MNSVDIYELLRYLAQVGTFSQGYLAYQAEHLHITSIVSWRDADEIYNDHCVRKNIAVERTPDIFYFRNDIAMPCVISRQAFEQFV